MTYKLSNGKTAKIVTSGRFYVVRIDNDIRNENVFLTFAEAQKYLLDHYSIETQRFIGKLPVNCKYNVINISYKAKDAVDYCICDNCGKIISNIAVIENEKKQIFCVGLDCATTMSLYQNDSVFDLIQAKKELARRAKFVKWYKTQCKSIIEDGGYYFYETETKEWRSNWKYRMKKEYFDNTYKFNFSDKLYTKIN